MDLAASKLDQGVSVGNIDGYTAVGFVVLFQGGNVNFGRTQTGGLQANSH